MENITMHLKKNSTDFKQIYVNWALSTVIQISVYKLLWLEPGIEEMPQSALINIP